MSATTIERYFCVSGACRRLDGPQWLAWLPNEVTVTKVCENYLDDTTDVFVIVPSLDAIGDTNPELTPILHRNEDGTVNLSQWRRETRPYDPDWEAMAERLGRKLEEVMQRYQREHGSQPA